MDDLNGEIETLLRNRFPADSSFDVHDWAASDCLAAYEWARQLFQVFPNCRVIASDLDLFLIEAASRSKGSLIFEEGGALLQYVRPPFVIDMVRKASPLHLVNLLVRIQARRLESEARDAVKKATWSDLTDQRSYEFSSWGVKRIPLIHPEAMDGMGDNSSFRIVRHSVFTPIEASASVIRTMNIFNRSYFEPGRLLEGIRAVHQSLVEKGLWIVGRTTEETETPVNNVTVWEKVEDRFQELSRLRGGCEFPNLVREFRFC